MTFNDIWEEIVRCTGNVITTKENTKFTYVVNENSIFIPKANWKITKSELEGAVKCCKIRHLQRMRQAVHRMCML